MKSETKRKKYVYVTICKCVCVYYTSLNKLRIMTNGRPTCQGSRHIRVFAINKTSVVPHRNDIFNLKISFDTSRSIYCIQHTQIIHPNEVNCCEFRDSDEFIAKPIFLT